MTDGNGSGADGSGTARSGSQGGAVPGPGPEVQWYIARDGQQHGPLSEAEMRLFVDGGHLRPTDLLWRPGFSDWRAAPQVFPPPSADPPPPAPRAREPAPGSASPSTRSVEETRAAARAPGGAGVAGAASAAGARAGSAGPQSPAPARGAPYLASQDWPMGEPRTGRSAPGGPGPGGPSSGGPATGGTASGGTASASGRAAAAPQSNSRALAPAGDDVDFDYRPQKPPNRIKTVIVALLILALLGAGGWVAFANRAVLSQWLGSAAKPADVPVVKANPEKAKAALATPPKPAPAAQQPAGDPSLVAPPAQPQPDTAALDVTLQKRPLWVFMKTRFPEWYGERLKEAAVMVAAARPQRDVTKHLVDALVEHRRKSADLALKASTPRHKAIATAFLDNLQSLSVRGPEVCYAFISQGETSSVIVDLMATGDSAPALEKQAIAIFEAVAEGRSQPVAHERPKKEDYDALASQLGKLGWSQADLQMFADPKALSAATPARVCQMVRDWFKAHVDITDAAVQERLLYETLRPVVGG